ncbi:guanine nucleotide-binding protein G(o) subunit alpha-like isoform X2 [Lissotriton helveticus]
MGTRPMGLCCSTPVPGKLREAQSHSQRIDREIYEHAKEELKVLRILLLGAAESGKSTIVKQMKIIHSEGFTQEELHRFKPAMLDNLLGSMKCVLHGMGLLRINLADRENKVPACLILSCRRCCDEYHQVLPFVPCALSRLWADAGVRATAARGCEFELNDSAHYFFEHMTRILSEDFCPTVQDVLRVRVRTCGVLETHFRMRGLTFRVYDVGGLRTERRKWIRCFEDVNAVLFVVALGTYDTKVLKDDKNLYEDDNKRLHAATPVVLFLNKMDLFQQKILRTQKHLRFYFPKYTGADRDVLSAAGYIASLFLGLNGSSTKCVYHHFTTATDTSNMQAVFQVVMETIIKDNLQAVYLL